MSEIKKPPLVCSDCIEAGPYAEHEEYQIWFCLHNGIYAVTKEDLSGWYLKTGVTQKEFKLTLAESEKLRTVALGTLVGTN